MAAVDETVVVAAVVIGRVVTVDRAVRGGVEVND